MERFDCTLWEYLKDLANCIPITERIKILMIIFEAAFSIQNEGLCHLDLKPSNIFIKLTNGIWDGITLKIADFGLARKTSDLFGRMGTPAFGSPEQFEGRPNSKSDNFALGKMAIMILNPWQTAWNLMAQPLTESEFNNHPARKDQKCQIISKLLKVSVELQFFTLYSIYSEITFPR